MKGQHTSAYLCTAKRCMQKSTFGGSVMMSKKEGGIHHGRELQYKPQQQAGEDRA